MACKWRIREAGRDKFFRWLNESSPLKGKDFTVEADKGTKKKDGALFCGRMVVKCFVYIKQGKNYLVRPVINSFTCM